MVMAEQQLATSSRVLRLRGMPFAATEADVGQFFADYTLDEIYLCKRDGRSTGEAYVVFSTASQAQSALGQLNKKYMGSRYIELFEAAEADLAAVKKVLEDTRLQGCVVRLRGLPYTATAADIRQFFHGVQLADSEDAIVFTHTVDGRPTGEAYVELADKETHNAAMMRHKELMGTRYIEIFHSSKMDKLQALQQRMCMPNAVFGRWHGQVPPRMAAAPRTVPGLPPAALPGAKALQSYGVDQLAEHLQGTYLSSLPAAPGAGQPLRVGATGGPQYMMPLPGTASAVDGSISPVAVSGALPAPAVPAGGLVRGAGAAGGGAAAAAAGGAGGDVGRGLRPVGMPAGPVMVGPDGHQHPMYFMHPMQQSMMPGPHYPMQPLGPPPYAVTGPGGDLMVQGAAAVGMMPGVGGAGQPYPVPGARPMMAAGGQWLPHPAAGWVQPGWGGVGGGGGGGGAGPVSFPEP